MSPSSRDEQPTPNRASSSSTLFGAFRNLTSGRVKLSFSPSPPPAAPDSLKSQYRANSIASAPSSSDTSLRDGPTYEGDDLPLPSRHGSIAQGDVLGGPPEVTELLEQVKVNRQFSERAEAIRNLSVIIQKYPIRNVLAIWLAASDLLDQEEPPEARDIGFKLLQSCVSIPSLSPVERTVFFKAICRPGDDGSFRSRFQTLHDLTNGGRNAAALETSLPLFITNSLDSCFKAARGARRGKGKKRATGPLREDENLAQLFQYISDILKFNSKIFSQEELELLLEKVTGICQETTQHKDINDAIKILDTVITYTLIPKVSLKGCLEVLCTIYRQLPQFQESTWNTLSNLFRSHIGQASISALLDILSHGAYFKNRETSIVRGVTQVLLQLVLKDGDEELPKVPMSLLLRSLGASIQSENPKQEREVIRLIGATVNRRNLRHVLLDEADWSNLIYLVEVCAQRNETSDVTSMDGVSDTSSWSSDATLRRTESRSDGDKAAARDDLSKILASIDSMQDEMDFVQRSSTMAMFMRLANRISDSTAENVVRYYADERYLHPSHEGWLNLCRSIVASIFKDEGRPRSLRLLIVQSLRDTYGTVEGLCDAKDVAQCAALIFDNIKDEKDVAVLHDLVDFAVDVADRAYDERFDEIMTLFETTLESFRGQPHPPPNTFPYSTSSPTHQQNHQPFGSPCNILSTAFVRLFTRSIHQSARKTERLFHHLLHVASLDTCENDARVTALKLLFRLRCDAGHALIVNASSEGERIAAVLCRTAETAIHPERIDEGSPVLESNRHEDLNSWRDGRKGTTSTSPHSSLTRHSSRQTAVPGRVSKPVPPLWMYPGPKGLPEPPSPVASRLVYSYLDPREEDSNETRIELKTALWLEVAIGLLQKAQEWDIYSYVLVHLGPQLSNHSLFHGAVPQMKLLRSVLCEQIRATTFHEPPGYTSLKKADVAVCLFHILTILISYHAHYEKSEEDELVRTFLHGIGSWDRTSKWCIHALTVCCHEIPLSISKTLEHVIQKMSQIITQPHIAIHILEFLTSLARMPDLYKNFREDEFKMVFGVSFRYLQYVRDQRERQATSNSSQSHHRNLRHSGASRDFASATDQHGKGKERSAADDLPQYVYALAFHVITFWFMALKMPERKRQIPWITRNLIYTDRAGKEVTEEQSQVIMDMMQMVAYSDRDETAPEPKFAAPSDGEVVKKTWIVGLSLLTIETAGRTGVSQITTRRPCGTRYFTMRPHVTQPPRHQVPITNGLASEAFYTSSYIGILPDDIFQSLYSPFNFPSVLGTLPDPPVPLPDDDVTRRAVAAFDRSPTVDGHKVGVIYIGEGQTDEKGILYNVMGSADYTSFLGDLGTLVRLKGAKFNTGGLDTRDDADGDFTVCWRDRCMELVFHITTMMPTDLADDTNWSNKKRHIGNDFVNIIFNDSGLPYNFDTFPSAFNYVHIVITPESRASFVERRLVENDPDGRSSYYKVQVIPKPGFPDISPAAETKIISGRNLAAYCRLIAINASVFSQVWLIRDGGESVSSWRNRLRDIKRLRERHVGPENATHASSPSPVHLHNSSSNPGFAGAQPIRESGSIFKRTSVATFISEGTSRSSMLSGGIENNDQAAI